MLATVNPDVVVGTESWVTDEVATGEFFPDAYDVFRRDRNPMSKGGGLFIAVKTS